MQTRSYPHVQLRSLAHAYEDLPAFHAAYFMLTLIFAGLCNLGFFGVLIAIHLVIDFWKYKVVQGFNIKSSWDAMFRENLTDCALFLLAFTALMYINPIVPGIAVLTGSTALIVTIARGLATLLPKLTILHHSLRILFKVHEHMHTESNRDDRWSMIEFLTLIVFLISMCMIASAPIMLHMSIADLQSIVVPELIPWRF